jgi:acyl-CoA hydrolase
MKADIRYSTPAEALSVIKSGDRVFVQGSAQTPVYLLNEMAKEKDRLKKVEIVSITVYGDLEIIKPGYEDSFYFNSMFVSASIRKAVNEGRADYIPVFLSDIPDFFKRGILPLDVAIVHVSVPDKHGYCSLGVSVDVARSAVNTAKVVIAQVNPNVPRTHGDGLMHASRFKSLVYCEDSLQEANFGDKIGEAEKQIGLNVASLIEDRSTLQMGIGAIPDAVLRSLTNHKDLGMHT